MRIFTPPLQVTPLRERLGVKILIIWQGQGDGSPVRPRRQDRERFSTATERLCRGSWSFRQSGAARPVAGSRTCPSAVCHAGGISSGRGAGTRTWRPSRRITTALLRCSDSRSSAFWYAARSAACTALRRAATPVIPWPRRGRRPQPRAGSAIFFGRSLCEGGHRSLPGREVPGSRSHRRGGRGRGRQGAARCGRGWRGRRRTSRQARRPSGAGRACSAPMISQCGAAETAVGEGVVAHQSADDGGVEVGRRVPSSG